MGLLRTILIIVLVYYGIKLLLRIFAPFLVKYAVKKAEKRFGGQFGQFQDEKEQGKAKTEGEVTIVKMPETKSSSKKVGDYVDYEEID